MNTMFVWRLRTRVLVGLTLLLATASAHAGDDASADVSGDATPALTESVVVKGIRGGDDAPVTRTTLDRATLEQQSTGQELPFLLSTTPSLNLYEADSGTGSGYAYMSLRGVQHNRLNFTFDGVPLNEPEDSWFYFADLGNIAGSLQSIEIQRGVGTSTYGAAAFGGSVNMESVTPRETPGFDAQLLAGGLGTRRASAAWNSGAVLGGFRFYLRGSAHTTDGYRRNSGVDQESVFFGAVREWTDSALKISGFAGNERSQLAFYATDKDTLEQDPRNNPLTPEERDRFREYMIQATWTRRTGPQSTLALQAYYHGAGGWYRIRDAYAPDVLQEYGLHWGFAGGSVNWQRTAGRTTITLGANAVDDQSRHTRDVVDGGRDYLNNGYKTDASAFAKGEWRTGPWTLFADAQVRHPRFRYAGREGAGAGLSGAVAWTFFNPKVGARYAVGPELTLYASAGRTSREPQRSDLLAGQDNADALPDFRAVKPEKVVDVETGFDWNRPGLKLHANVYAMEFRDEFALTGELSEIGLPVRRNVDRSARRGLEVDARWDVTPHVRATLAANVSRNRIRTWTQYYDEYDQDGNFVGTGTYARTFHDVEPLLTPTFSGTLGLEVAPVRGLTLGAAARHVASSYLDNTNAAGLEAPSYTLVGLHGRWEMGAGRWGKAALRLQVDNALDAKRAWPGGYSYLYVTHQAEGPDALGGTPYYFPLAGRTVFVGVDLSL